MTDDIMTPEEKLAAAKATGVVDQAIDAEIRTNVTPIRRESKQTKLESLLSKFVDANNVKATPAKWFVKQTLHKQGVAFLGGQSAAGKTFVALELARCVTTGEPFFGRKISEKCGVVFLLGEGSATMPERIEALKKHHQIDSNLPIHYLSDCPNILEDGDRALLIQALNEIDKTYREKHNMPLGLVIVDTLAATIETEDENNNSEAAKIMKCFDNLAVAANVVLMPVHHLGKDTEAGLRGASAWFNGSDIVLSVTADRDSSTGECQDRGLSVAKNKFGQEGPIGSFELKFETLGIDEDGEDWGSLVVSPQLDKPVKTPKNKGGRPGQKDVAFEKAFAEAVLQYGTNYQIPDGPTVKIVDVQKVREAYATHYATSSDDPERRKEAQRKAFKRATDSLQKGNSSYSFRTQNGVEFVWRNDE